MTSSEWQLSLKLVDQPKSTFHFPEMMPGDVSPGGYRVATLKQLVAAQFPDSIPDPELIGLSQRGRSNTINWLWIKCFCACVRGWQDNSTSLLSNLLSRFLEVNACCVLLCCLCISLLFVPQMFSCLWSELVHCGRKLKDELTLDASGIQPGSTVHILKKTWPEPESNAGVCVLYVRKLEMKLYYKWNWKSDCEHVSALCSPEPVNRATAAREFRVFHAALHSLNSAYRDSVSRRLTQGLCFTTVVL